MSINKPIISFQLPDTLRTLESQGNDYGIITGMIVSLQIFSMASVEDFVDFDRWNSAIRSRYVKPLHNIKKFEDISDPIQINESIQNYTYLARRGNPRFEASYLWDSDFHATVDEYTNTDVYVFFHDINWNLYGTNIDGVIRGFKTNRLILHDRLLQIETNPAYSILDVELSNPEELNNYAVIEKLDFDPTDIDRLYSKVVVEFINSSLMNLTVYYEGVPVTSSVDLSDITITDSINGELTFSGSLFGEVYQLRDFGANLITGSVEVISSLYMGCTKYTYAITVEVVNNFIFEDANNFIFEDGNNFIFETQV